jgi:hypothetical protein
MVHKKQYLYKRNKFFIKKRIKKVYSIKRFWPGLQHVFSFYLAKKNFPKYYRRSLYEGSFFGKKLTKRKVFFYVRPFFVHKLFFSNLIRSKVLKRLATIW